MARIVNASVMTFQPGALCRDRVNSYPHFTEADGCYRAILSSVMFWFIHRLYALNRWLSSRTGTIVNRRAGVGIFALVGLFFLRAAPAFAQNGPGSTLITDSILQSFAAFSYGISSSLVKLIVLLIDAMVPIMTFNNFVGNPVVEAGWAIVRDTVNMFFVIILIIIAFGTIFGAEKFKWQQQVPRLLIMAIVVNFSKTLCGILIDFGQVIMLTFANALREIAAGNFIQLLGLDKLHQVSQASSVITGLQEDGGKGASQAFDFFAAGLASMLLTMWVLATLVILVAILLFRIIMLWILVVIAPLAWFMKGAKGIIDSNAYEDWWKEFKCMVGIGPVLTFFLWLTLAVAGAGNIAANSKFTVSTVSNSADLTPSIFEVDNFLSFLIGMAMLFAGFKAASQFCTGDFSAKFVGKAVGVAKSIPALAGRTTLTGAGLGLKGGSLGLRAGARGLAATPDLARGVARRLPISGLSTVARDAGAAARGAAWGAVGAVGGKTFVGKFGRGKQMDTAQEARVMKFKDVNQEKEAMKDKGRPWMQQRIQDNLKNPPSSDKGRAQDLALFESMMGDKRLQKDLGSDTVEALWKRHGTKYGEMAKGNAAKTGDLEDFKKKYANITGSTHLIKNADDTKGLAAGAWQDSDVQERAGRIQTTFKGKDGQKNLNALEAAREGHYGIEAQQAAIKGTDVTKLDVGKQMEGQFEAALQMKDKGSADAVIKQMQVKYTDAGTTEQDRQKMALSMDRMRAAADKMGKGGNTTAAESLTAFDATRKGMETKSGFGVPPAPQTGESGEGYVNKNYGQASKERMDHGVDHFTQKETAVNSAIEALDAELNGLKTDDRVTNAAVAAKRRQIEEVRARIERSTISEIDAAYDDVRAARKLLDEAKRGGDSSEIELGEETLREAEATHANVQIDASNEVKNDGEIQSLTEQISALYASIDPARGKEVAQKSRQIADLNAQAKRLADVKKKLEEERKKRA